MKANQNTNRVNMYVCLGTQPVVKSTSNGGRMANFYAMNVGSEKENAPLCKWFRVISWGKNADIAQQHLTKGKKVFISGTIQKEEYKTKKGEVRMKEVVVVSSLRLAA
ncbi:MAG: single-stranded DNA-binding protein [Bacteroidia bacterium]|nr:single-stranded DNA-binding protein [Bacteroidia bacterium]